MLQTFTIKVVIEKHLSHLEVVFLNKCSNAKVPADVVHLESSTILVLHISPDAIVRAVVAIVDLDRRLFDIIYLFINKHYPTTNIDNCPNTHHQDSTLV